MGNRPCIKCGAVTWWWSDPLLGCNLCVPPDTDWANIPDVVEGLHPANAKTIIWNVARLERQGIYDEARLLKEAYPELFKAIALPDQAITTEGLANTPSQVSVPVAPVWNGDPLQGLRCTCTHTMATHSPRSRACLLPTCDCLQFTASEVYVPRSGE